MVVEGDCHGGRHAGLRVGEDGASAQDDVQTGGFDGLAIDQAEDGPAGLLALQPLKSTLLGGVGVVSVLGADVQRDRREGVDFVDGEAGQGSRRKAGR